MSTRDELRHIIERLADFGEKRVGTPAGCAAGDWLVDALGRFGAVREDRFTFPHHRVLDARLELRIAGGHIELPFDVLEASGAGVVQGPVVFAGWADQPSLLGRGVLEGAVALVERNALLHRSTQVRNLAAAGAAAVIVVSAAPANLRQVGSVRRGWEAAGPIPAIAIGALDGASLKSAVAAGQRVEAEVAVEIAIERREGRNVAVTIPGEEASELVVGAHYDTWFQGATDNGAGVAVVLALAERCARRKSRHSATFVAWDGEEIALYGGYHHLRKLRTNRASVVGVIGFETPAAHGAQAYGLARTPHDALEAALAVAAVHDLYALNAPMDLVPELFGGVIPTDVQAHYRGGLPAACTAGDSPYYHTREDTPDKVDLDRLAEVVARFDHALAHLLDEPAARFASADPALWRLEVTAERIPGGVVVDAEVRDGHGVPQSLARVEATAFVDDFFAVSERRVLTDPAGRATLLLPLATSAPKPILHVTAGKLYPVVEKIV